ncbi:unnamed protein product [Amoebophrya sp. A25]|nr:unnamed protein product [Amoebophrya sp. A25]|eukprot:GSA25T00021513001.1
MAASPGDDPDVLAAGGPSGISPEFECALCLRLLLDPVSVSCGHTFCRSCIETSLDHRSACPLCRQPIVAGRSINVLIQNLIQTRYPEEFRARQQEQLEELRTEEEDALMARDAGGHDGAGGSLRRGVTMFASERFWKTTQVYFPEAPYIFKATQLADEHIVDHLLETSREFAVEFTTLYGSYYGELDTGANSSSTSQQGTRGPGPRGPSASTSSNSVGYLFQIESADRDADDHARLVVCRCKSRIIVRNARAAVRPETGTAIRYCDVTTLEDGPVDVTELVLPHNYRSVCLDPSTGRPLVPTEDEGDAAAQVSGGVRSPRDGADASITGSGERARQAGEAGVELTAVGGSRAPEEIAGRNPNPQEAQYVITPSSTPSESSPSTGPQIRHRGDQNMAAMADECGTYLAFHLEKLGQHARQRFVHHHGDNPMRSHRSTVQAKDVEKLTWYLCRILAASAERKEMWLRATDLKLRLQDCLQVFRECKRPGACLLMPGSAAWMKLRSQWSSAALLLLVLVLLWLKGTGRLEQLSGRGKYMIDVGDSYQFDHYN